MSVTKKILLCLFLILLFTNASAAIISPIENPEDTQQDQDTKTTQLISKINILESKIDQKPGKDDVDSSFRQVADDMGKRFADSTSSLIYFVLTIILLNDILILCIFGILKAKGWL